MTEDNQNTEVDVDIDKALDEGLVLYAKGEYYEAHEIWEEAWNEAQMDDRRLLQALIQIAAGFYKLGLGQPAGTAKLLEKAIGHLKALPETHLGIALTPLIEPLETWQQQAKTMVEQWQTAYDKADIPAIVRQN